MYDTKRYHTAHDTAKIGPVYICMRVPNVNLIRQSVNYILHFYLYLSIYIVSLCYDNLTILTSFSRLSSVLLLLKLCEGEKLLLEVQVLT